MSAQRVDRAETPPPGRVDLGDLARLEPLSRNHGYDRGTPVDRPIIERFLGRHSPDIRGAVLEVQNPAYAEQFGGTAVTEIEVLDVDPTNPLATLHADLSRPEDLPAQRFDCFICTQTLQFVFDLPRAVRAIDRLLKPDGVLLLTVPGISYLDPHHSHRSGEYWRFTTMSVRRLLAHVFPSEGMEVTSEGNLLSCIGYLVGLAAEELPEEAFSTRDEAYPLLVTARCRRG